jgi:PAS domain S-box-containing protein
MIEEGRTKRDERDLYRLLIEAVQDYAIFALDPQGYILTWNPGAERFKGYTAREAIGKHFSIFYPQEAIDRGHPQYELEVAAREGRFEEEGWRIRKDGSRFWANVVITALRDEKGELVGYGKVTRDLTVRREATEELRRSEERLRLLIQSVKDYAIFMLNPDGTVASWNEGAERAKGYTASEIIGQSFERFYPAEKIAEGFPRYELEMAAREGRFEDEGWRLRKDGTRFWANVVITALRDPATNELIGFAKITRDLTERKAAEDRALEDARRITEVEAANRAKAEFLAAMSHELRTPLNAISGYVELLESGLRGPVNETQVEDLGRIKRSGQHLLSIINDLLNFSRLEAGTVHYDITTFDVAQALDQVRVMVEPLAAAKSIELSWPASDSRLIARGDIAKVEQILVNLIGNAVKFTEDGGRITISQLKRPYDVHLVVTDTGIGIPDDQLEAIFEPFVQVGRTLSSSHEGTGLGLAISRDLARAMAGDLTATSTMGVGSTFTLCLPSV